MNLFPATSYLLLLLYREIFHSSSAKMLSYLWDFSIFLIVNFNFSNITGTFVNFTHVVASGELIRLLDLEYLLTCSDLNMYYCTYLVHCLTLFYFLRFLLSTYFTSFFLQTYISYWLGFLSDLFRFHDNHLFMVTWNDLYSSCYFLLSLVYRFYQYMIFRFNSWSIIILNFP